MDDALFDETRRIKSIYWEPDGEYIVGRNCVDTIRVVRVAGQGAYVPWFEVVKDDGTTSKHNAAFIAGVCYEND